jgi:hypothetical protein
MSVSTTTYTLDASELASVRAFIGFQNSHAIGSNPVAPATIDAFIGGLDSLSNNVGTAKNERIKLYYDDLFGKLLTIGTVNGFTFSQVYIMNHYANACNVGDVSYRGDLNDYFPYSFGWKDCWRNFRQGYHYTTSCDDDWNDNQRDSGGWGPPPGPPAWNAAIAAILTQWGDSPPSSYVDNTRHLYTNNFGEGTCYWASAHPNYVAEKSKVNGWLTGWPSSTQTILQTIAPVWAEQKQDFMTLLGVDTLPAEGCFFLLYLLPALMTGDAASQSLAAKTVSTPTSSPEYPNDVFVNQLVYLALMYLADPLGSFGWNNQQLQAGLRDLSSVVVRSDPASVALATSLTQHGKILYSDASYPMVDPYAPNVGISQRKTDTLFALDKTRAAIRNGLTP